MKGTNNKKDAQKAKEFTKNLSSIAKEFSLRVSKPYGYYPEDVEKTIRGLKGEIANLSKENQTLTEKYNKAVEDNELLKNQLTRLELENNQLARDLNEFKIQQATMELPAMSPEVGFMAMNSFKSAMTGEPLETPTPLVATMPKVDTKPKKFSMNRKPTDNNNPMGLVISSDEDEDDEVALDNLITKKEEN